MEADIKSYEDLFYKKSAEYGYSCPKVHFYESIDSTNDQLNMLAKEGAKEGECIVAFCQTNGHGRSGRNFYSPAGGNLYMSILLRPKRNDIVELITPMAAVATARAISSVCEREVDIKWVNDLYLKGRKVCGILAQGFNFEHNDAYIVLGIGINVRGNINDVPDEIKDVYGCLFDSNNITVEDSCDTIPVLAASLLANYMQIYNDLDNEFLDEYRKRSNVIGKSVKYISGEAESSIEVIDIDDRGGLVTKDSAGKIVTYRDGEIRIRI